MNIYPIPIIYLNKKQSNPLYEIFLYQSSICFTSKNKILLLAKVSHNIHVLNDISNILLQLPSILESLKIKQKWHLNLEFKYFKKGQKCH